MVVIGSTSGTACYYLGTAYCTLTGNAYTFTSGYQYTITVTTSRNTQFSFAVTR